MSLRPDRHPSPLLLVVGILALGAVGLVGALLARSQDRLLAAEREVSEARARYAAEAGLAVALETLRSHGGPPEALGPIERSIGDASFAVHVNAVRGDRVEFVSRGESAGSTRTVTGTWRLDPETGTLRRCHER
jgi:hypothetical protein